MGGQTPPPPPARPDDESHESDHEQNVLKRARKDMKKLLTNVQDVYAPKLFGAKMEKKGKCCYVLKIQDEAKFIVWILVGLFATTAIILLVGDFVGWFHIVEAIDNLDTVAIVVSGLLAGGAVTMTVLQVRDHWSHNIHPPSQKHVVRILFMVPAYAFTAWLGLMCLPLAPEIVPYIDFARAVYEAFVIYTFLLLLTKYIGGHKGGVEALARKPPLKWPMPMCCLPRVRGTSRFLWCIKYATLQYVIIMPLCSVAAIVCAAKGVYGDGELDLERGYVYVAFVINNSQLVALYALAWLYLAMKEELTPFQPMKKFLVVKAVVFFTFWQSVLLAVFVHIGWLHGNRQFQAGSIQVGLQDFLVCVEMLIAAVMHKYAFGLETYNTPAFRALIVKYNLDRAGLGELDEEENLVDDRLALTKSDANSVPPEERTKLSKLIHAFDEARRSIDGLVAERDKLRTLVMGAKLTAMEKWQLSCIPLAPTPTYVSLMAARQRIVPDPFAVANPFAGDGDDAIIGGEPRQPADDTNVNPFSENEVTYDPNAVDQSVINTSGIDQSMDRNYVPFGRGKKADQSMDRNYKSFDGGKAAPKKGGAKKGGEKGKATANKPPKGGSKPSTPKARDPSAPAPDNKLALALARLGQPDLAQEATLHPGANPFGAVRATGSRSRDTDTSEGMGVGATPTTRANTSGRSALVAAPKSSSSHSSSERSSSPPRAPAPARSPRSTDRSAVNRSRATNTSGRANESLTQALARIAQSPGPTNAHASAGSSSG